MMVREMADLPPARFVRSRLTTDMCTSQVVFDSSRKRENGQISDKNGIPTKNGGFSLQKTTFDVGLSHLPISENSFYFFERKLAAGEEREEEKSLCYNGLGIFPSLFLFSVGRTRSHKVSLQTLFF